MALQTDNVFYQLEQGVGVITAMQLALVMMANQSIQQAFEMFAGNRAGFEEQRKRLIVLLNGFKRQGPDDKRDPYVSIQDQAHAYVRHSL